MKHHKKVTNPITLIAIFATLSETSAAITLPFLDNEERDLYVWFLISFPFYLLLLFFVTLNFNYRSLYAPSDFADERNFIKAADAEQSNINSADSALEKSTSIETTKPPSSTGNAQAPPAGIVPQSAVADQQPVPLPADAKELKIIDTRNAGHKN